ncbi:hydrolase [Wenjunlia vitaminophila]|uniref:Hydrolase n=1 Tax=Wenjunlia vitaminophila TaxID=76728 RepID=A0A0T6LQ27_WENVI|nr:RICIN domain-containing protein [Wenjunlia vitaminophila]KRV48144.1 hydrolase [Wenjunlia vitaminophila]
MTSSGSRRPRRALRRLAATGVTLAVAALFQVTVADASDAPSTTRDGAAVAASTTTTPSSPLADDHGLERVLGNKALGYAAADRRAPEANSFAAAATVCDGDGTSGRRVQVLYVRGDGQADRYGQFKGTFQSFADQIDAAVAEGAARTGSTRHVRFATDSGCRATVDNVVIPQSSMATVDSITNAIKARGYNRTDRKYLFYYENSGCGLAYGNGGDDRPGADNPYNGGPHYAAMGTGCWTWQASAHEVLHTLGAVRSSAPHATAYGHCWDDEDIMCYNDGGIPNPPGALQKLCSGAPENQVDCHSDDYFNTNPPTGSYLTTHWNVANSQYLVGSSPGTGPILGLANKCVDVASSNTANGTAVQLWGCNGTAAQRWTTSGQTLRAFGKCMDVTSSGTADGTKVQLWDCNGTGAQNWVAYADGTLRNPQSGKCLDVTDRSSADGARLQIWSCHGDSNQVWRLPA